MGLSEFCIRRPIFTCLLMLAVLVGGIVGYKSLSVSALPDIDFPTLQVSVNLPGASPETMATSVATPLERQFSTIAGIVSITSTSYLGYTQITLQFDLNRNLDGAALDVQTSISAAQSKLPKELPNPPSFKKVNPADQPVFFIAVSSDTLPMSQVNEYADTLIAQRISTLPGVAQVTISGPQKYVLRIRVNPESLAARNLSFQDISAALAAATSITPAGVISGQKQLMNLEVVGQPKNANDFKSMIVSWHNNAPVRLQDIASVEDSIEDKRAKGFLNKQQAIVLAIQRQTDANTVDVVDSVRALLPVFQSQVPASVELTPLFDRSVPIRASLEDVEFTLKLTIFLVILVIFLFLLKVSATLIPALTVPFSILATYGVMALLGFSLNNISLMALTLCVGFVVDDAIVMVENIMRYVEKGLNPFKAAIIGAKEIGFTIISMTFSLVAVFIPVLFMGGVVGRLFREFAVTISVAILASGFVSLTLTPMMASLMLHPHTTEKPNNKWINLLEKIFNSLLKAYEKSLTVVLKYQRLVLALTVATFFSTLALYAFVSKGFFPLEDIGFITAQTEAAQDISFDEMVAKQSKVVDVMKNDPAVENCFSSIGGTRGPLNSGRVYFNLKPVYGRPSSLDVIKRLRQKLIQLEGIKVYMKPVQNLSIGSRHTKGLYQYTLQSPDLKQLQIWGDKMKEEIAKISGIVDVSTDLQLDSLQVQISIDRDKAESLGISYSDIRKMLYNAFGDSKVGTLYTSTNDYDVILEIGLAYQTDQDSLKNLYLRTKSGKLVKLESIATFKRAPAFLSINHGGQLPSVTVSFNMAGGAALGDALKSIQNLEQEIQIPKTVLTTFEGQAQALQESLSGMVWLLILSVIVIYIILGMLYESFFHPLTILSGLPSAGIGAIITLMLLGMELNIMGIIGIVMLIGIVKKNAIMMVDFAIQSRNNGQEAEQAIFQACLLRFRPIMMTTMAAIFGTLPIALGIGAGAELRQPLGIVVVGGLLTSQLLTLYITPVVYLYLERWSRKLSFMRGAS